LAPWAHTSHQLANHGTAKLETEFSLANSVLHVSQMDGDVESTARNMGPCGAAAANNPGWRHLDYRSILFPSLRVRGPVVANGSEKKHVTN
jgi:hypothetical protein